MSNEKLSSTAVYRVADYIPNADLKALGLIGRKKAPIIRAMWTGEKRLPKAGEWYLSGASISAYRAANDLSTPFHIARLVAMDAPRPQRKSQFRRYWINQPSALQPDHKLHGKRVLADKTEREGEEFCDCYFLSGSTIRQVIHKSSLSEGWPEARK